ncbi:DELLA protein RGL2 [Spatholobus suberectus]|nr:DELLA protein RGL2 [Spatholobus suberectus]
MEDHVSESSFSAVEDNFSSSNDIFWATVGLNEVKKVQFSGAEDHGEYGGIDSLSSSCGFVPYDPSEEGYLLSTDQQKCDKFDMASPPLQFEILKNGKRLQAVMQRRQNHATS